VLHSEHVISRSGIAVSPREWKRGRSLPCSSERWRCVSFHHRTWPESADFFQTHAEKLASRRLCCVWVYSSNSVYSIFLLQTPAKSVAHDLHVRPFSVAYTQHRPQLSPYFRPAHALLL